MGAHFTVYNIGMCIYKYNIMVYRLKATVVKFIINYHNYSHTIMLLRSIHRRVFITIIINRVNFLTSLNFTTNMQTYIIFYIYFFLINNYSCAYRRHVGIANSFIPNTKLIIFRNIKYSY